MIGLFIFLFVVGLFIFLYFKKGMYEALIISSIVATIGVLFIPDTVLYEGYLRLFGRWRLVIFTMNELKIIIIVGMVLAYIYMKSNKSKIKGVIS